MTTDCNTTQNPEIFPCILASIFKLDVTESLAARIDYSNVRNQKRERKSCGPLNSIRQTRAPPATFPHMNSGLALRGHIQVMPGNKCTDGLPFLFSYVLEFNSVQQKMAEGPSAGCELQDENGKKAFQLFKNSGYPSLSHAYTVINNVFVFVDTFRCTSSGRYVRTNSTSKHVTRGCVIWTIVRTIDENVSHKTKDKVRNIFSRGNLFPYLLYLSLLPSTSTIVHSNYVV